MDRGFIKEKCGVLALVPYSNSNNLGGNILKYISAENLRRRDIFFDGLTKPIDEKLFDLLYVFTVFLERLSHRGYDGYGFALNIGGKIYGETFSGKVSGENLLNSLIAKLSEISLGSDILTSESLNFVVGHVRYCTSGGYESHEHQPYIDINSNFGLCFNGNINMDKRYDYDGYTGYIGGYDSKDKLHGNPKGNKECIYMASFFSGEDKCISDRISSTITIRNIIDGAFSTIVFDENSVYGFRDKLGTRPLVYANLEEVGVISSETCIIDNGLSDTSHFKDISSNQFIAMDRENGLTSSLFNDSCFENLCLFEYIYFSDSNSVSYDKKISDYRMELGRILGEREDDLYKDESIVIHVPKSSYYSSVGYCEALGIKSLDIIKKGDRYKRSFIQKKCNIKDALEEKFVVNDIDLTGKSVYLIDDSLVRGNTMLHIIEKIRKLGADKIHIRIPSPMIRKGCNLGICTVDEEVICQDKDIRELCEYFNVNSIKFLEIDDIINAFGNRFCLKCFNSD